MKGTIEIYSTIYSIYYKVLLVEGSSVVKVFLLSSRGQFRILGSIYVCLCLNSFN